VVEARRGLTPPEHIEKANSVLKETYAKVGSYPEGITDL
jgi:hypothetical protein